MPCLPPLLEPPPSAPLLLMMRVTVWPRAASVGVGHDAACLPSVCGKLVPGDSAALCRRFLFLQVEKAAGVHTQALTNITASSAHPENGLRAH